MKLEPLVMLSLRESPGLEWIFAAWVFSRDVTLKAHDVFVSSVLRRLDQIYLLV